MDERISYRENASELHRNIGPKLDGVAENVRCSHMTNSSDKSNLRWAAYES